MQIIMCTASLEIQCVRDSLWDKPQLAKQRHQHPTGSRKEPEREREREIKYIIQPEIYKRFIQRFI